MRTRSGCILCLRSKYIISRSDISFHFSRVRIHLSKTQIHLFRTRLPMQKAARLTPGCFLHRKGRIRTGAGANDMPGACQSRDPACPAGQVESRTLRHVVADFVSFAAAVSFAKQTPSLIRSVVHPRKNKTALLPCRDKSAVSFNAHVFLFFSFPSIHNGARRRSRPTRRGRRRRRRSR